MPSFVFSLNGVNCLLTLRTKQFWRYTLSRVSMWSCLYGYGCVFALVRRWIDFDLFGCVFSSNLSESSAHPSQRHRHCCAYFSRCQVSNTQIKFKFVWHTCHSFFCPQCLFELWIWNKAPTSNWAARCMFDISFSNRSNSFQTTKAFWQCFARSPTPTSIHPYIYIYIVLHPLQT